MKAVAKLRPEPGAIGLIDACEPTPKAGEALVKIEAAGICGTDVSLWHWHGSIAAQYNPSLPLILGHEFAGRVVHTDGGLRAKAGDLVAVNPQIACGHCYSCSLGRPTLCEDRRLMGGRIDGGWTEYVCVPETHLYPLPAGTDPRVAPLLEPLSVATHAVVERVPPRQGDTVTVIGAGPIGLLVLILARAAGAGTVFITGVDADASRLELARRLGGVPINVDKDDPIEEVKRSQRDGCDIVYETSGNHRVFGQAIDLARRSGRVGLIGLCHSESTFHSLPIVLRELEVIGSRGYNETTWMLMMRLLPRVEHEILQLVSHTMPYDEIETALHLVQARQAIKIILKPYI